MSGQDVLNNLEGYSLLETSMASWQEKELSNVHFKNLQRD